MEKIIDPISKSLLKAELTEERRLRHTNRGGNDLYIVDAHNAPHVMQEIGRLREIAFRAAGGGTGMSVDIDEFDTMPTPYKQLVVWNPDAEEIIGGYRYLHGPDAQFDAKGQPILATSHMFHFSEKFIHDYLPRTLELGRSFVAVEYQASRTDTKGLFALDNLFDGLAALTVVLPDAEYFFGKMTMYPSYDRLSRDMILYFLDKHFGDRRHMVSAYQPLFLEHNPAQFRELFVEDDFKLDYRILNAQVRQRGCNIPPLVNAYMNLSPTMLVFGTAINHEFGAVEETGILISVNELHEDKRKRHILTFVEERPQFKKRIRGTKVLFPFRRKKIIEMMKSRLLILLGCMLMAMDMIAESTKTVSVTFSDFPKGVQYAENEQHNLGDGLVIYTTQCHFTEQLRIYASSSYNGYVISDPLPGTITNMSFKMGYNKEEVLDIYGSTDKENWTLVKKAGIETTSTSYKNYTLDFPIDANYTCFKLDVRGSKQIRIESMSVTYVSSDNNESNDDEEETVTVSAPIFSPGSSTFSTESLNITIEAAKGCDIYYTTDGNDPSYTNSEEYIGTKENVATIHASNSPIILKAIAVNPATGQCSDISCATYTYVFIKNDGSKSKPYTVAEVKAMAAIKSNMWVKGIILGTMVEYDINKEIATSNFKDWNIVIGDESECIPVQLPSGNIKNDINLKGHPYLKGKEILIRGNLERYCESQGVKEPNRYEITYTIPINKYGYATLFLDMPVSMPIGSTAYYCTTNGNQANLCPIGSIIPSNVGVIIESTPNSTCTLIYTTEINPNEETIRNHNQLIGFVEDTDITMNGKVFYALNAKDDKVGFYIPQTATDARFTAKANKAYLQVAEEYETAMFIIHRGNDETGIIPTNYTSKDILHDLQGRLVASPTSGIYIKDGKKIVIK